MQQISIRSRAKINITLDVLGKRPDGYHEMCMIMQTVNLYDMVYVRKMHAQGIKIKTNLRWLPNDEKNIAYQAAQLFKERYGIETGISIELNKRIPVAAGMAGGSSNAAAVLVAMRYLFAREIKDEISNQDLMKLGVQLGADVPYCILRGTALAEGIGEILTPLPPMPHCYVLLAKPKISVSTPTVFKDFNLSDVVDHPPTDTVIEGIKQKDIHMIAKNMGNVLESVTIKRHPVIAKIKSLMLEYGALGAMMSGSGPTVFGLYSSKNQAYKTAHKLKLESLARDVFVTTMYNREERIREK